MNYLTLGFGALLLVILTLLFIGNRRSTGDVVLPARQAEGGGREAVLRGVDALLARCGHLTVVTNEVFSGGAAYGEDTLRYLRALAAINRLLAARADTVAEIICGLPNYLKGGPLP